MTIIDLLPFWHRRGQPELTRSVAEAAARTHVGKVRLINEDRFLVRSDCNLWAVADGMGGHCGGTEAANAAIDALSALADAPSEISAAAICAVLVSANASIYAASNARRATSGTTIVVAWLNRDELTVFWVGDSRAYWIRNSCVQCLTRDHSLVQALIDAGEITATEARMHPDANVVTRALGAAEMVEIDRAVTRLRIGDRVILCSDGVSRSLGAGAFANGKASLGQFADDVLGNALRCDGSDNATIVAVQLNTLSRV